MQQSQGNDEVRLTDAARACAITEHALWAEMLQYSNRLVAEYSQIAEYFLRTAQLRSIALEMAVAMNLSEGQVHRRSSCAQTIRDQAPNTWAAFADGKIDATRATIISDAIGKLARSESVEELDAKVVAFAETHTSVELRTWVKKFIARVKADLVVERAEAERADRHVEVVHDTEGNQFWHTLITGKDGNVLEHWYHGRFAPTPSQRG